MGTGGTDREEIVAALHEQHGFCADVPRRHASVGKAIDRNALRKVGTGWIGLRCSHDDLQRTTLSRSRRPCTLMADTQNSSRASTVWRRDRKRESFPSSDIETPARVGGNFT